MKYLLESEIDQYITVCPYCMDEIDMEPHMGCCGEVHSEDACLTVAGDVYLDSEYEIIPYSKEDLDAADGDAKLKYSKEN